MRRGTETMMDLLNDFRVALYSGDFETAERLATNELALLGESALWLNALGLLHAGQGRMAEALLHFDRAAAANPRFVEAILNGAVVLSELGFYDEAAARFQAALEIDGAPGEEFHVASARSTREEIARRHVEIAKTHRSLGQRVSAVEELRKAIETCDLVEARIELARVHLEERQADLAIEELEQARRLDPRNPEIHVIASQCHLVYERRRDALESLARAELLDDRSRTGAVLRKAFPGSSH